MLLPLLLGISYATDDQTLREAFTSFGEVTEGTHFYETNITFCKYF